MRNSNILKKVLCVMLSIGILLSLCSSAFAAEDKPTPVIVVSGMGTFPLVDADTGESAFPMSAERILKNIPEITLSLGASVGMRDWSIMEEHGLAAIHDMLELMRCDENGNSVYNVKPTTFPEHAGHYQETFKEFSNGESEMVVSLADKIGWENVYFHYYDWRMSPIDLADDLDALIKKVLSETGSKKVSLAAFSFGGTIVSSYVYKYGNEKIENLLYGSTAFLGTEIVGELFTENPDINIGKLLEYLSAIMGDSQLLSFLFGGGTELYKKYGPDFAQNFLDGFVEALKQPLYAQVFMDTFICFPGIWSLMPYTYYEEAKEKMTAYTDLSDSFIAKTDAYMEIQKNTPEMIYKMQENDTNVYIIGGYGYSSVPVISGTEKHTDALIDTYLMTGYCTVAPFGETIDDKAYSKPFVCNDKSHNHKSTDGIIDASTAILPEHTWVIDNMMHVEYTYGGGTGELATWIVTSDKPVDVHTDVRYPQFTRLERESVSLISLTEGITSPSKEETPDASTKVPIDVEIPNTGSNDNWFFIFIARLVKELF